jgi:hypothetical protein
MHRPDREPRLWLAATFALVAAAGAAFWVPGLARTGGRFPVPLDDVFIHFGFARAAALGHPFSWIPGNGYSSGGTSLTYPLVLAPGWILGFRGERLALFAALVACASLVDLARSLRAMLGGAPRWIAWAFPPLLLSVPLLDWSLFSGMETALFGAVAGRAVLAVHRAAAAEPARRARAQIQAGVWAAVLVATRPEAAPLALLLALATVHAAGSIRTAPSLARAVLPVVLLLAAQATANRALTGEWSAAGAVRKLSTSNPYGTPLDVVVEAIKNLAVLRSQAFQAPLGGARASWIVPLLGLAALLDRRNRRLALPLLLGAVLSVLLVSLNTTARFQNFRYAAPALLMILAAAAIGAASLARRGVCVRALAGVAIVLAAVAPARAFPRQIDHFSRSSANIAGQQVEVAARLAARVPRPRCVLVGDAGAIPYLSGLPAIDGLGLGGYRGMPFARASVHGVPAVVELIERIPPGERPDILALYPSWWPGLADVFGRRIDAVRIEDNVICGAAEKVIYAADWSALAPPGEVREGAIDEIDVADLVDERAHAYEAPVPHGGWVVGRVLLLGSAPRFDAGRIVPEGRAESFAIRARANASNGSTALVLRTDGGGEGEIRVTVTRGGALVAERESALTPRSDDRWHEIRVALGDVRGGDRVTIFAARGAFRDFHVWLVHDDAAQGPASPAKGTSR